MNAFECQIDQMRSRVAHGCSRGRDDRGDLMFHNVDLRLGDMMLNYFGLLVHNRLLVMNDRLRPVRCDLFLVGTGTRVGKTRSWDLGGRRRGGCRPGVAVPVVLVPVVPVPVVPVPVVPVPVVPVPVVPVPVVPVPVVPVPVVPVPVVPAGGELLGMRYERGAANGMSPDWPNVAMIAPPAPTNCPVLGRNTAGWVDPVPR